jgi:hypothetical protein
MAVKENRATILTDLMKPQIIPAGFNGGKLNNPLLSLQLNIRTNRILKSKVKSLFKKE